MRASRWLLASIPLFALLTAAEPQRADACGACFHGEGENTQVTGHRMIFSISKTETTLWDQISYTGDPSSFAWVLPVKGTVEIGLSSDAMFSALDQATQVAVNPPPLNCPVPPDCYYYGYGGSSFEGGGGAGGGSGGVDIISQEVVGPYETVTLHSTDANALTDWLASHSYVLQPDFAPVVAAYVAEGFDFVAMKLVPGMGVESMKPVRITTPGAGVTLPLRMVAGGTGAVTPITLWILGEGRYQPQNFQSFTIEEKVLVWDFFTSSSNYSKLRQTGYEKGWWLVETSGNTYPSDISYAIDDLITYDPTSSGYGDPSGNGAAAEAQADYQKLWGSLGASFRLTRVSANVPRALLANDLVLGASADQGLVSGQLTAQLAVNVPPCPTYTCDGYGGGGGYYGVDPVADRGCSKGCTVGGEAERAAACAASIAALGLLLLRRRRDTKVGFTRAKARNRPD